MSLEHAFNGDNAFRVSKNLSAGWQVMVRGTFVANGCRWHDNMSNDKSAIEHPRSSTGDELFASQRDHLFEETSGKRRANPWMKDGQTLVINCDLEYGMCPDFALQMFDDACFMLLREFGNDIL